MQNLSRFPACGGGTASPLGTLARGIGLSLALLLLTLQACLAADAESTTGKASGDGWEIDQWYVYTSLYTHHWSYNPDHVNKQKMLGLELQMKNRWLFGLSSFDNSFGQRSEYLYAGYKWDLFHSRYWYFKLTGGLLYGYKEPYEDKIPFNGLGIAPAIIPTLGIQYKFFVAELNIAGTAALNVTAGFAF